MASDQHQTAEIDWNDQGVPVSRQFDDPYFSLGNGLLETQHVFLDGNDLPARISPGFHIAELGFGSGLNLLATALMLQQHGLATPIHFTSFEAFPMAADSVAKALSAFPELTGLAQQFLAHWAAGKCRFQLESISVDVILGDANQTLANWSGKADAWFLDGFSPAKNPELWNPALMAEVAAHTNAGGTVATYTAAGHIRRSLSSVGFSIDRIPGFGTKRHMTVGQMKAPE